MESEPGGGGGGAACSSSSSSSSPPGEPAPRGEAGSPPAPKPGVFCPYCLKKVGLTDQDLEKHLANAGHSPHDPACGSCGKHFKCLLGLHTHLEGSLGKAECVAAFKEQGCRRCLRFFADPGKREGHGCCHGGDPAPPPDPEPPPAAGPHGSAAVALDCEMVGVGRDGSACARVSLVGERGEVLLDTLVQPSCPVTDYRAAITGLRPADLRGAPKLRDARRRVVAALRGCGRDCPRECRGHGPPALLVGHDLRHDLKCLGLTYPLELVRDTATYPPLLKTCGSSHKLRDLAATYLGRTIQGHGSAHSPAEDASAAMSTYLFMRGARPGHGHDGARAGGGAHGPHAGGDGGLGEEGGWAYRCWCLDVGGGGAAMAGGAGAAG